MRGRRFAEFARDWRNWMTLFGAVLVALLMFIVIDSALARREYLRIATDAQRTAQRTVAESQAARESSDAEIASLRARIDGLLETVEEAHRLQGESAAAAAALASQVRQLGARPVAMPPTERPAPTPTTSMATSIPPTPTPMPAPSVSRQNTTTSEPDRRPSATTTAAPPNDRQVGESKGDKER